MKKLIFALAFFLPIILVACGDEDDEPEVEAPTENNKPQDPSDNENPEMNDSVETPELKLDISEMTADCDDTILLEATTPVKDWSSSNPFVATIVTKGATSCRINTKHIGETVITASNDSASVECKITVRATNNNFTIPIIAWGSPMEQIREEIATQKIPDLVFWGEVEGSLCYTTTNQGNFPWYLYTFLDNKLAASTLVVDERLFDQKDLMGFLEERYQKVGETEDGFIFGNAESL